MICRMFWPREIWGKYAKKLDDFKAPENAQQAVGCLNELVTDALRHAPYCLQYMAKLRNPDIFRFCAIPQVQPHCKRTSAWISEYLSSLTCVHMTWHSADTS